MKIKLIIICLGIFLFQNGYAQKKVDKHIYTSSSLNFYPELKSYSFFNTLEKSQANFRLRYVTQNSGTFTIDTSTLILVEENINRFPSQIFNIGASVRFSRDYSTFHEISLSRLSRSKSSVTDVYTFPDSLGNNQFYSIGHHQKSFILTLRYEYGKMFGYKKNGFRFGLSGFLEPSFYAYSREVLTSQEFPIKATILSFSVGVIPMASIKLSKKVFLDLKVIPRVLVGEISTVALKNPILSPDNQSGSREYNFPEIDIAGSIQIRYLLKETKKRRK